MTHLRFTSEATIADGTLERDFLLRDVPGILWTPTSATAEDPVPLVLMGHPGGIGALRPRLVPRAMQSAQLGLAASTIELPGKGERPTMPDTVRAVADLRAALARGEGPDDDVVDRLILPLVEQAAPEWQELIDELLQLPEIAGPVAISGGVTALGVRLACREPRISAVGLFAGSYVPTSILAEARDVTIPVHMLLQWDDEGNDRNVALQLFDALGSAEKTLQANMGGHTGVPAHAGEDAARFFARHLGLSGG